MSDFDDASHHGSEEICNWCGCEDLEFLREVLISDVPQKIYKCDECDGRTSKKRWGGEYRWRPAIKKRNSQGVTMHIVAGKES